MILKTGDKIECINRINEDGFIGNIQIGEIYTVAENQDAEEWVYLKEKIGCWSVSQFKLVEQYKKQIKQYGIVKFLESIEKRQNE